MSKYEVFSSPYFPVFRVNLNSVFSPNTGKHRPEETPHFDTFHAVHLLWYGVPAMSTLQWLLRNNKAYSVPTANSSPLVTNRAF